MSLMSTLRQSGITNDVLLPEYQREGDAPVYLLRASLDEAPHLWEHLRTLVEATGYWPILGWDLFKTPPWSEASTRSVIEAAEAEDVKAWFYGKVAERIARRFEQEPPSERKPYPLLDPLIGSQFAHTPAGMVSIALIPSRATWEGPAYLRMYEETQAPEVHVAVLHYWHARWKAEVTAMNSANLEVRVLAPPTAWDDARQLAIEQYLYCEDLVDQGTHSIRELANSLLGATEWRFWWD